MQRIVTQINVTNAKAYVIFIYKEHKHGITNSKRKIVSNVWHGKRFQNHILSTIFVLPSM